MKLFLFLGEAKTDWTGMFPEHRLGHLLFVMTMSPRIDVLSLSYLCLQDKQRLAVSLNWTGLRLPILVVVFTAISIEHVHLGLPLNDLLPKRSAETLCKALRLSVI